LSPPGLERLVRACLTKDPDERIQTAHDVKLELQWIAEGGSQAGVPAPVATRRKARESLAWVIAGVAGLAVLGLAGTLWMRPRPEPLEVRFTFAPDPGLRNVRWPRISPDGRVLAFLADDTLGVARIWIRPMNALAATPLAGVENPGRHFWSPDSRSLAFVVGNQMKRISVHGGPTQLVAELLGGYDGSWGDGVILFDGSLGDSIRQAPADGGEVSPATRIDRARGEVFHAWPYFLPDGKRFLFLAGRSGGRDDFVLKLGRLGSLESTEIGPVGGRVEYARSGQLLYVQGGTLIARPFDAGRGRFTGGAAPVAENVSGRGEEAHFSVSNSGTMAFLTGSWAGMSALRWLDRSGQPVGEAAPPAAYRDPVLSIDGMRVAYGIVDRAIENQDIWVRDLRSGIATRVTHEPKPEVWPVWSPDGTRLAYAANQSGTFVMLARAVSGTGAVDTLYRTHASGPTSWSADGRSLFFVAVEGVIQMRVMSPTPGASVTALQRTRFNDNNPQISRDGRWLAYTSDETGRTEVFVQAYPGPGGRWRVSTNGGSGPRWRADGRELFYRAADGTVMAVPIRIEGAGLDPGTPIALFRSLSPNYTPLRNTFDVRADGQRFLVNSLIEGREAGGTVNVLIGWSSRARNR
jgi:Tol biopolymer transport system component